MSQMQHWEEDSGSWLAATMVSHAPLTWRDAYEARVALEAAEGSYNAIHQAPASSLPSQLCSDFQHGNVRLLCKLDTRPMPGDITPQGRRNLFSQKVWQPWSNHMCKITGNGDDVGNYNTG